MLEHGEVYCHRLELMIANESFSFVLRAAQDQEYVFTLNTVFRKLCNVDLL